MPKITYRVGNDLDREAVLAVYRDSTLGLRRPMDDPERMEAMVRNAQIVVTAWDGDEMVGIARALSDFVYITYLADLAVKESHQRLGIGKELIRLTREQASEKATLLLLAAPAAVDYYPHIGFQRHPQAWMLPGS